MKYRVPHGNSHFVVERSSDGDIWFTHRGPLNGIKFAALLKIDEAKNLLNTLSKVLYEVETPHLEEG